MIDTVIASIRQGARRRYNRPQSVTLVAGSRLGVYEVISALGSGGMGEVYRATDTVLKRQVALKLLFPEFADSIEWRLGLPRRAAPGVNLIVTTSRASTAKLALALRDH